MQTQHNAELTAPEIATLWTQYQSDTLAICMGKYMLNFVEDADIRPIIELFTNIAQSHLQKIEQFLSAENFPIPQGFTDQDVFPTAPHVVQRFIPNR